MKIGQKNVASRVLIMNNAPHPGGHGFLQTLTIFKLNWTISVTSRELTRFYNSCMWKNDSIPGGHNKKFLTKCHEVFTKHVTSRVLTRKNDPAPCCHVFQQTGTIFKTIQDIIRKKKIDPILTRETAPDPWGHVFQPTGIFLELFKYIIETNVMTKFHELLLKF
ncbi:hypothetical protein DPMN_088180 [Dreissena polymorpha]|uniref:Uncharacterized protein n=1 Tax=Dreissena polymorpha TaxID=45954 RepID=A0A9D4KU47_DREPO|nr:hypothetical protein DPMN_088180 [Dreissena polymorpha]